MSYRSDRRWSDRFIPEVKRIVAHCLYCETADISEAPLDQDRNENTDLIILALADVRIGVRLRKREIYEAEYGHQFTIRADRPKSGMKTELAKILEGWGDYFFYGMATSGGSTIDGAWLFGDLEWFRDWWYPGAGERNSNRDGSSEFDAFDIAELPSSFIIDRRPAGHAGKHECLLETGPCVRCNEQVQRYLDGRCRLCRQCELSVDELLSKRLTYHQRREMQDAGQ